MKQLLQGLATALFVFQSNPLRSKFRNVIAVFVFLLSLFFSWESFGQTTVFTDDFSTNTSSSYTTSGAIGASAWSVNRIAPWGARRNTSPAQLELTSDVGATLNNGYVFAYTSLGSFSSPFNGTLNSNTGVITWTFNMRTNRTTALTGFGTASTWGMAFVLASTSNTPNTSGSGYAVAIAPGSFNKIGLVSFTNGLEGTLNNFITYGNQPTNTTDYLSVKVTYNPLTDSWSVSTRDDGTTAFADPASGSLTSLGTATNSTYTGTAMSYMGAYWQGAAVTAQTAFFDNVTTTVATSPFLNVSPNTALAFNLQATSTNSNSLSFNLFGANLTGAPDNITVTSPTTDFQVSNDNSTWGATATIAYSSATLSATSVYVRFTPQSAGAKSGNVTFSGGGVSSTPTIAVSGTGKTVVNWTNAAGGDWQIGSNWSTGSIPTANDIVTFNGSYNVAVTNVPTITLTSLTIGSSATVSFSPQITTGNKVITLSNTGTGSGAALNIQSGGSLTLIASTGGTAKSIGIAFSGSGNTGTIAGTLTFTAVGGGTNGDASIDATNSTTTVSGTLSMLIRGIITSTSSNLIFANGGTFKLGGTNLIIPTATWQSGSTCEIDYAGAGATLNATGLGQSFHHFTVNCPSLTGILQCATALTTINGDFTLTNTGLSTSGSFALANSSVGTLTVGGNLTISNNSKFSTSTGSNGSIGLINLKGNLSISGTGVLTRPGAGGGSGEIDFVATSGTQTFSSTSGGISTDLMNFKVGDGSTTTNTLQLSSNFVMNAAASLTVLSGATLDCNGTNIVQGTTAGTNGSFVLNSGGGLIIGSTVGIVFSLGATTGNIQTGTTKTFSTGGNYTYTNASSTQVTGSGLPSTVNKLTINNGGGTTGVTLSNSTTVTTQLAFTAGKLTTGSNTLVLSSGGTVTGAGTGTGSYVSGNLQRTVANGNNVFDIGNGVYAPVTLNFTGVSGTVNVTGKSVLGTSPNDIGGNSGINSAARSNHYWILSSSGGSFTDYTAAFNISNTSNTGTVSGYKVFKYTSGWTQTAPASNSSNIITTGSLTNFGDFELGEPSCVTPTVSITSTPGSGNTCIGSSATFTASGADTYVWAHSGSSATSISVSPTTTTVYSVTGTVAGGCSATQTYTITVNSLPTITVSSSPLNGTICTGSSAAITATGAATYLWSPSASLSSSTGAIVTASPTTTTIYTVTGTSVSGCSNTQTYTITVNGLPSVTVSSSPLNGTICTGSSATLTADGATTYVWSPSVSLSPSTGATVIASPTTTTIYSVTGTTSGCSSTQTYTITVNNLPSVSVTSSPGDGIICNRSSAIMTASGANTYLWSPSASLNSSTGAIVTATPTTTTVYTVTGTTSSGCSNTQTYIITVNPIPTVSINPPGTTELTCTVTSINLTATGDGDSYSWSTDEASTTIDVSSPGTYSVITTANGCTDIASIIITQNITTPSAGITNNSGTTVLTCAVISISVTATAGVSYSWDGGTSTAAAANSFTTPGTYSVTVTAANGCTDVASIVITQDIAVTAGITNNSGTTVLTCSANSISVTATGGVSYVWDGGTSAATTANNFNAPGTYTVIVTAANGCTDVASIVITQDISTPDVSNISGDFTKTCSVNTSGAEIGEANDASATYLWSPSAGLSSATVSNPTANPTVTTTYTVIKTSNANGCSATATITVTVNGTTLNVSVNNSGPVCPGSDITLTSNATDGVSPYAYSWSGPNSTIDPVANPTITSATTLDVGTYSVIVSDANGCSATASTIVSLLPLPNPSGVITGPYVVCAATSGVTFTAGSVPGAISYLWSSSTTSISIVSGQGTNEIVANFANSWAVGFLTVVPFNQCGADTLGTSIHMRSVPGTPSLISGPTFVCVNSSGTYSVNPMPNYSNSFSWSVPAGMSITSGQGTNSITVSTISSWSQGTISVHAVNSCGSGVDRILIVRSVPNQPGLIVGPGIICKNSSANYSVANVLGATSYTWVAPSGMSITAGQSTNSVSVSTSNTWTSGTISVTASGICGSSTARTFALKSIPSVPGVINGQSTGICQGSSANYSVVSTNGVVYSWIAPTGASIAAGQGSNMVSINYSLSFPSSGTVSVYGTNDCGASGARSLNVSGTGSTPSAPGTITTNTIGGICPGENRTYSVSPVGGITYSWTVPSGASILSGQTSNQISVDYLVTFTASGNISVIAINSCGNSPSTSLAASLGTVPSVPGTINVDISGGICPVDTRNYSIATVANATGYTWSAPGGATINTGQGTNSINLTYDVTFTTGDISVTASNNCGSSLPKTLSVSLGSTPSAPASIVSNIPGTVCPGDSRTYSISSPIAGVTYNWTIPAGGGITSGQGNSSIDVAYDDNFVSTGSVSVTAQNNCGTSGATSRIVIHGPAPANPGTIVTNIPGSVCSGESRDYSVPFVSGISYNWAAPQASNIVSGQGTNVITVLYTSGSPTPDSVKVTASDYCGSSSSTFIVNLSSSPGQPGSVSGATLVCQNSSQSYSVPSVGGVTYNWTAPSGASISTGQGTNTINVNFSSTFTAAGDLIVNTSNGCGQSIDQTLNIDFNNSGFASGPISGPSSVCIGSIYSYSVLQMNGVTYTWIAPSGASILAGQGSRSVSVKFPAAYTSAGNLSVTTSTGCGSIATTLNITPSTTPAQPSIISGVSVACNGYQITYSVASIANATSYIWTIPAGSSGSSSTNSILVTYGPTFTGGYVSVKASNACGTGLTRTKGITTGTAPAQPGAIAGVSLVCNGSYTYSVATVAGASSYAWTLPSGSSGISTTNSIAVTYDNTFTGGSLGVASVACGSSAVRTLAVSLGSTPSPASSITGSASQCAGATGVYSVTYVNGVTYNWTAPVGASIASGQGTNAATVSFSGTFTAAGNLNVTAGNGCGQSSPSTLNIASNNSGPGLGAITGNNLPCLGTTNVYSVTSVSGLIYNWTAPSGATILSGQGSNSVSVKFTTSFTVAANLSVSANTICGTSNVSLNITPNSAPVQPSLIAGTSTVCNNNSQVTYSVASIANANTYLWTLPSGSSGSSSNNNITVTYGTSFAGGYLSVKASNGCGTGLTRSKGITLAANCGARQLSGDASTDIEEAISVYPNPATEQVTVSFNSHAFTQYHLSLVDMMGREVVSRNGTAVEGVNTVDMNLSSVAKGYYLVHLVSGNSDKIVRMVVE